MQMWIQLPLREIVFLSHYMSLYLITSTFQVNTTINFPYAFSGLIVCYTSCGCERAKMCTSFPLKIFPSHCNIHCKKVNFWRIRNSISAPCYHACFKY